jgi:CubicO group peptidase (beta-lactamase class C family)
MIRETRCAIVAVLIFCSSLVAQTTQPDIAARLDALASEAYPSDAPARPVIVVVDGQPVLRKGYGLADTTKHRAVAPDDIFRIGSLTKQFTAVAILQLVQDSKVKFDDPITKYVADFDTRGKTITIEHLLSHTSGLANYTSMPGFDKGETRKLAPREVVALTDGQPLDFDPGSKFKYSNTGYVLLGMVIEKASGQSYADYMAEHVFKPAGMKDTRYSPNDIAMARHARGYEAAENGFSPHRRWT